MSETPLVRAVGLTRYFDVSLPFLNRVLERKPKMYVKAVEEVFRLLRQVGLSEYGSYAYPPRIFRRSTTAGRYCARPFYATRVRGV